MHSKLVSGPLLCALYVDRSAADGFTADHMRERMIGLVDSRVTLTLADIREVLNRLVQSELVRATGRYPDISYAITPLGVMEAERTLKVMDRLLIAHKGPSKTKK